MKFNLSAKEKEEVAEIVSRCNLADGTAYSAPLDADLYWISKSAGKVIAVLSAYELGETCGNAPVIELSAFTDPSFRGKGRMRRLLEKCAESLSGIFCAFKFQAYPCPVSEAFLTHKGYVHAYDELVMKKKLGGFPAEAASPEEMLHFENAHSELSVSLSGGIACIYNVRTDASHLREGSAEALLRETLSGLAKKADTAVLEVSSANLPAVGLYEKAGFTVDEKLEMWYNKPIRD